MVKISQYGHGSYYISREGLYFILCVLNLFVYTHSSLIWLLVTTNGILPRFFFKGHTTQTLMQLRIENSVSQKI